MIPTEGQLKQIIQEETGRIFREGLGADSLTAAPLAVLLKVIERLQQEFGSDAVRDFSRRMQTGTERRRAEGRDIQAQIEARRHQRDESRKVREKCWDADQAFKWLLDPCPVIDEEAIDLEDSSEDIDCPTKWVPLLESAAEVEAIRAAHLEWKASGTTQAESSWMFDRFSRLGLDWRWVLMREYLLKTEFVDGIRSPHRDVPLGG